MLFNYLCALFVKQHVRNCSQFGYFCKYDTLKWKIVENDVVHHC